MRILLVRLRLIGDVVFTTPLIRALRRRYPDAHLSYVVEPAAAPIVHGNPHLDQVVVVPRGNGVARLRHDLGAAARLRRLRPDVAIDLHGGPRSAWLTWLSGARMRIGYRIQGRTWMYTHPVSRTRPVRPRHSVLDQWDLLDPLGIPPGTPADDPLEMPHDPAAAGRVESCLRAARIDPASLVVMHVSASNPFKQWPPGAFETLIVRLVRADPDRRICLTAGPSDTAATRRIAAAARQQLGPLADAVPDLPDFDLAELRALVARAALYVGGDSGPLHVAATTGVPILAILGPTLPERTRPWRDPARPAAMVDAGPLPCRPCDQRRCEPGDFRCLTRVSPDRVAAEAEALLAAGAGRFAPPVSCQAGG